MGLPCHVAGVRLAALIVQGELGQSSHAYQHTLSGAAHTGPAPVASRPVSIRFLEPVERDGVTSVRFHWETAGPATGLFPVLDADIRLTPDGDARTRLVLAGTYGLPGRVGTGLDKALLPRVADTTMRALLTDLEATLTTGARTLDLSRLRDAIVVVQQQWAYRVCNRALTAWLQSAEGLQEAGWPGELPVSAGFWEDEAGRYVVISGPGAWVRAVFGVGTDGRITRLRIWPEGLTGC